ncbi:4-hydroxyphenylacetate 3-hydroxylase N-terminal domain-containing protein [Duganella sp. PWIR1]
MAVRTGSAYLKGLDDQRSVWLGDREVSPLIEPAFAGSLRGLAGYFDWQHRYADDCVTVDPETGETMSASLLVPKSREDLAIRHRCFERLARYSVGMMGRTPDYVNVTLAGYVGRSDVLSSKGDLEPARRLKNFYREVVRGDLALTHCIVQPAIDRSCDELSGMNADLSLRVVRRTKTGVVVRGAKVLATLGPFADEMFVYPSAPLPPHAEPACALMFSIPVATKGLIQICRDHYGGGNEEDRPFSSRFDEQDTFVIFDDVEIPYERLFIDGDIPAYNALIRGGWLANIAQQTNLRAAVKLEFAYDLACRMAETMNAVKRPEVAHALGELLEYARLTRAAIAAGEAQARDWGNGTWFMDDSATRATRAFLPVWMVRANEIIINLGSHNLLATPSIAAFGNPKLSALIEQYMPGAGGCSAQERARIFRTAWDFVGSGLGSRNALYERFYLGSSFRAMSTDHMQTYAGKGPEEKGPVDEFLAAVSRREDIHGRAGFG